MRTCIIYAALLYLLMPAVRADDPRQGAALLKTDIMGVFAHPDDETGVAATLAYYARARNAVIANVYCTRGEGGGNMAGTEWGPALGILREAELRDCLAAIGVTRCYFLDRLDWAYTESVAATLEKWGKDQTLERLVRLIRSLRPEVIITMNPAPSPGQHGHHQAAGVLATEAVTAAADPARYSPQITREGLGVWQPRRLFYAGGPNNLPGATIVVNEPISAGATAGETPARIAGRALANHRSQAFGTFADSPWLRRPQRFTVVKAWVASDKLESDLLAGLPANEPSVAPLKFWTPRPHESATLEFKTRPAIAAYRQWCAEQGIEHVASDYRGDVPVVAGKRNDIALHIAAQFLDGDLVVRAPQGWTVQPDSVRVRSALNRPSGDLYTFQVIPPPDAAGEAELTAEYIDALGARVRAVMNAHPVPQARVRKIRGAPEAGTWAGIPPLAIGPDQLVQGKVAGQRDSSGEVRLAHNGRTLFLRIDVKDDAVIANIAPNDIRGHWRSDSVEICLDPNAGRIEHTMASYKLGIFPFDSSGVVRAARDADARQGPVEETAPETRIRSARTADGYRIEAAIPFWEIGLKKGGGTLGFNVIIYDGDKLDAKPGENINKSRIAWSPCPGVQGRPEDWGRLELE